MEHVTPESLAAMAGKLEGFLVGAPDGHPMAETLREASVMLGRAGGTLADLEGRLADALAAVAMLRSQESLAPAENGSDVVDDAPDDVPGEWITDEDLDQLIAEKVAVTLKRMLPALRAELASAPTPTDDIAVPNAQIDLAPMEVPSPAPLVAATTEMPIAHASSASAAPFEDLFTPVSTAPPEVTLAPGTDVQSNGDAPVIERAPLSPFASPGAPEASAVPAPNPSASTDHVGFAPRAQTYEGPFAARESEQAPMAGDEGGLLADLLRGGITTQMPAALFAPPAEVPMPLVTQAEPISRESQPTTHPIGAARPEDPAAMANLGRAEAPAPRPMDELREPVAGNEPVLPPWAQPE